MPRSEGLVRVGRALAIAMAAGSCTTAIDARQTTSVHPVDYAELGECLRERIENDKNLCPYDLSHDHNEDAGSFTLSCTSRDTAWASGGRPLRAYDISVARHEEPGHSVATFTAYRDALIMPNYRGTLLPAIQQCARRQS